MAYSDILVKMNSFPIPKARFEGTFLDLRLEGIDIKILSSGARTAMVQVGLAAWVKRKEALSAIYSIKFLGRLFNSLPAIFFKLHRFCKVDVSHFSPLEEETARSVPPVITQAKIYYCRVVLT